MISDEDVKEYISIVHQIMKKNFQKNNKEFVGESAVIHVLNKYDGQTAGELAKMINVGTGRLANILNSLETKQMIIRKPDDIDKRKTRVFITEIGKNKVVENKIKLFNDTKIMLDGIGEDDTKQLIRILSKIANIKEDNKC